MANTNTPFGFVLIREEGKEARVRYYEKAASAIYQGDVVKLNSSGTVEVAAAGDQVLGVAAKTESAASTDKIAVFDDPEAEFMVQVSGIYAAADVGQNANIVATAADTSLNRSKHNLDTASQDTTSTLQFKILGLMDKGENAVGSYSIVRVKPNNHAFNAGTTGI